MLPVSFDPTANDWRERMSLRAASSTTKHAYSFAFEPSRVRFFRTLALFVATASGASIQPSFSGSSVRTKYPLRPSLPFPCGGGQGGAAAAAAIGGADGGRHEKGDGEMVVV